MKKIIKKIILVISLVAVLVSSMVLPSFAYDYGASSGGLTWYDFMGDTDLHMFKCVFDCDNDFDGPICIVDPGTNDSSGTKRTWFHFVFEPLYLGNAAKYNGAVAIRWGGDQMHSNNYTHQYGFFDLTENFRAKSLYDNSGFWRVDCYKVSDLLSYRNDIGTLPSYASHMENSFFTYYDQIGFSLDPNSFIFSVSVPYVSRDSLFNLPNVSVVLFPSIGTTDDIYRYYKTLYDLTEQDYQDMYAAYKPLEDENATLKTDIETLTGELAGKDTTISEYKDSLKDATDLINDQQKTISDYITSNNNLVTENSSLTERVKELQNSVKNNSSLNGLFNGIGQGFSSILDSISGLGVGGLTVGACIAVAVVIFVVFIIIKLILR